jgi:23S rRNA (uracil1939-C5)-methyltransferase
VRSGKPVHALHRDLYRNPLRTAELDRFAAVVLDPPRSGARDQVVQLAASKVPRIAYVSCNPSSWARCRDAGRRRLSPRRAASGRPVPLVDPRRAGEPVPALRDQVLVT